MSKLDMYYKYFKYVCEHKVNVFKVCWSKKMYIHAFIHDLSKFRPSEFIPYAKWFYGPYGVKIEKDIKHMNSKMKDMHAELKCDFNSAWTSHYMRNKHHWHYWMYSFGLGVNEMPEKYINQMICDWEAMSIKLGDTPKEYYHANVKKIELHDNSRRILELKLGYIPEREDLNGEIHIKDVYNHLRSDHPDDWVRCLMRAEELGYRYLHFNNLVFRSDCPYLPLEKYAVCRRKDLIYE